MIQSQSRRKSRNSRLHTELSPEQRMLCACARAELDDYWRGEIGECARKILWGRFWKLAVRHGIGFFAARHLQSVLSTDSEESDLPERFRARMRADVRERSLRCMAQAEQLIAITKRLQDARIEHMWIKGLLLSLQLYGRIDARGSGDIDVLVPPDQVPRVGSILESIGYTERKVLEIHPQGSHHRGWYRQTDGGPTIIVEVHHRLAGPPGLQPDPAGLLARKRTVEWAGQSVRVPSLEDGLLIACLHAHQHQFSILRTLMDVAEYIDKFCNSLDWGCFWDEVAAHRGVKRVRACLGVVHEIIGINKALMNPLPQQPPISTFSSNNLFSRMQLDPSSQYSLMLRAKWLRLEDKHGDMLRSCAFHFIADRRTEDNTALVLRIFDSVRLLLHYKKRGIKYLLGSRL